MNTSDLLARIAASLRHDIGPAVADDYARTQAFMAAVVLKKVADELAQAEGAAAALHADVIALASDLQPLLATGAVPPRLADAFAVLRESLDADGVRRARCTFVEALYAERAALGEARFEAVLARVRQSLRADIDRQLVYAA